MPSTARSVLRVYAQHVKRYWPSTLVLITSLIAVEILLLIIPLWYKRLFDGLSLVSPQSPAAIQGLVHIIVVIALLQLARQVCYRAYGFIDARFLPRVMSDLERTAFQYLLGHSYQFFTDHFSGALVRRIQRLSRSFETIADQVLWRFIPLTLGTAGMIYVLFHRSVKIGWIMLIWVIVFLIVNYLVSRWKLKYDAIRAEKDTIATATLADSLTNNSNIKTFATESSEANRFASVNEDLRRMRTFSWTISEVSNSIQGLLVLALEVGIMWLAIYEWQRGLLTIGDFALLQAYLLSLIDRLWDMSRVIRQLYEAFADAKEIVELMELPHGIRDRRGAKKLMVKKGEIRFDQVGFSYHGDRLALDRFDLTIRPGEKVAIVGPSGAGKSTIVKALFRFYDLNEGRVMIDGQDISKVTQQSLRGALSLVPQESILFHRTLSDNIRYGKQHATDQEVIAAAKKAHCHEFIVSLSQGYETFVGERGIKLSGGERQRVAIARAILKNAPILVLDEATSSLDSESEALIQDALRELMKRRTVIVIAHRLSTIMMMDRIVVVRDGNVVDHGTHAELLKKPGVYKTLWDIQAGGFLP